MKKNILALFLFVICFKGLHSQVPNQMSIYPNPASSEVNIKFSDPLKADVTVTISDILGNRIETIKFTAGSAIHIDLSPMNLKNGFYLVKVEAGDQSFLKKLVIKS